MSEGTKRREGKTKIITPLWEGAGIGRVETKETLTKGDGATKVEMEGKAVLSTRTTCNVFDYLTTKGVPLAYIGRDTPTTFLTWLCDMIPVEVVVRKIATGSYLKRNPDVAEGTLLPNLVVEFYLKTTNRRNGNQILPCDDPLMVFDKDQRAWKLSDPKLSDEDQAWIGFAENLSHSDSTRLNEQLLECTAIARQVFYKLDYAWGNLRAKLYDFKLEFGVPIDGPKKGEIVVADVIDSDSWRVKWNDLQLSKQGFRDGDDLGRVLGVYRVAAALTDRLATQS